MAPRLKGKRALVTAAAAGIGEAIALAFAKEGAHVLATDLDEAGLKRLTAAGVAETARLDVRDTAAVNALVAKAGALDILVNCAGFVHHGTALQCNDAEFDRSIDLNLKSMHRTIRAVLPQMLARKSGAIVNIASAAAATKTVANRYIYATTKGAVQAMTKAVAIDFITEGVRCNCICPGTIDTPSLRGRVAAAGPGGYEAFVKRQPMGRLGTAEEVAAVAVYLASDESRFTTGTAMFVDGGFSL